MITIDGREFIQLQKKDSGFCRFVSGNVKGARNIVFLDQLRLMRTRATVDHVAPAATLFQSGLGRRALQRQRETARVAYEGDAPKVVQVKLPAVAHLGERTINVKASIDPKESVAVELAPDVLLHIFHCMNKSEDADAAASAGGKRRKRADDNKVACDEIAVDEVVRACGA